MGGVFGNQIDPRGILFCILFVFGCIYLYRNKFLCFLAVFIDVHLMVFVGFGFLMTFMQRYGYGAVGLTMVISVLCMQWGTIVQGFFHYEFKDIPVTLET